MRVKFTHNQNKLTLPETCGSGETPEPAIGIMKKIYLDHAATTPVDKKVLKAMLPYFSRVFGNAMSLHSFGQEAVKATEKARRQTADFFGCDSDEIVFTSGATEANNLAVKGVVKA